VNLILLGKPGAGKGTQAERLKDELGLSYIGTGDLLRKHKDAGTALGVEAATYMDQGRLVPDALVVRMILAEIEEKGADGFLLDGYPRNIEQADALAGALEEQGRAVSAVLLIDAADDEVVRRLSGRRQCTANGHVYHVDLNPPRVAGVCDVDGSELCQRDDDKPETIRKRLATYREQTAPLIDYYDQRGLLRRFDGSRSPADVFDEIRAALEPQQL
jgi:adenylate kinase